jgi:LysM repeat protein
MMKKLFLIGASVFVLLLVSLGAFFIWRLPPVVDQIPSSPTLLARIQSPFDQSDVPSDSPTTIRATSFGTDAVTTLQLWVNGLPVDSKTNASPSKQFDADFAWQPFADGDYLLVVRAIDQSGRIATSSAVRVHASSPSAVIDLTIKTTISDTLESLAQEYDVPLDHLLLLNPQIDPKQILKPDQEINIPIGLPSADIAQPPAVLPPLPASPAPPGGNPKLILPALPNPAMFALGNLFGTPKAPIAPEVAASMEGCKTNIFISDKANNESGFFLYQLKGNDNAFKRIAVFDANNDSSPLKYVIESSPLGSTQYYVAAFNATGESPSDIVIAHITDVNCAKNDTPKSKFKEPALVINEPVEDLYCYTSLDDLPWKRLPSDPNLFLNSPNTKFDLSQHLGEFTSPQVDVTLEMECWGWKGGALKSLGKGIQIIKAKQTGAFTLKGLAFTFNANLDVAPLTMPQLAIQLAQPLAATPPKQIIPAPFGVSAESDKPNNQNIVLWNWTQVSCFPPAAGQPAQECPYVNDIEGFKIYGEQGGLIKTLNGAQLTSSVVGIVSGKCFTLTAFKGVLESKKSKAGCVDADLKPQTETNKNIATPYNLRETKNAADCVSATGDTVMSQWCEAAFQIKMPVLVWDWTKQSCFPQPAGEVPKPCPYIGDIDGFKIYNSYGFLIDTTGSASFKMSLLPSITSSGQALCFYIRAYKGYMESPASNTVCVKPPVPDKLTLKPSAQRTLMEFNSKQHYNSACPLPKKHLILRGSDEKVYDAFNVVYIRKALGLVCDKHNTVWFEGAVKFPLTDLPPEIEQATLHFISGGSMGKLGTDSGWLGRIGVDYTSNVSCTKVIATYHYTLGKNQEDGITYLGPPSAHYGFVIEDLWTSEVANAPNLKNSIDVTPLIKKNLQQGKKSLGFVWLTDEELRDDNDRCVSSFHTFEIEVKIKK